MFNQMQKLPDITRSSEYLKDDFKRCSALIGIASINSPLNLYKPPFKDGIIRIHWPLFVN